MKQVWLVNHYAVAPGESGGTRHFDLACALRPLGWQMSIVAAGIDHVTGRNRLAQRETRRMDNYDGVPFLWLRTPEYRANGRARTRNMAGFAARVARLAWSRPPQLARPHVVVGSTVHPAAALAGWFLARRFRVPFVFEIRDLWPETLIAMGALRRRAPQARLLSAIERFLLRRARAVVALLPGIPDYVESRGMDRSKVVWIPNGVRTLGETEPAPPPADHPDDWSFTFMYFGAFGNANDLETLLQAFGRFETDSPNAGAGLRLIGEGPLKSRLQQQAGALGLNRIRFEPPVPKREIPARARQADAFVLAVRNLPDLYQYGIGMNKLFDYMAAGRPTVIANCALNDPIRDSQGGISVASGDVLALSEAMTRVVEMRPEERRGMGERARDYVRRHHTSDVLGARFAELLEKVSTTAESPGSG